MDTISEGVTQCRDFHMLKLTKAPTNSPTKKKQTKNHQNESGRQGQTEGDLKTGPYSCAAVFKCGWAVEQKPQLITSITPQKNQKYETDRRTNGPIKGRRSGLKIRVARNFKKKRREATKRNQWEKTQFRKFAVAPSHQIKVNGRKEDASKCGKARYLITTLSYGSKM